MDSWVGLEVDSRAGSYRVKEGGNQRLAEGPKAAILCCLPSVSLSVFPISFGRTLSQSYRSLISCLDTTQFPWGSGLDEVSLPFLTTAPLHSLSSPPSPLTSILPPASSSSFTCLSQSVAP